MDSQTGQVIRAMVREMDGETPGIVPLAVRDRAAEAAAAWPVHPGPRRKIWRRLSKERRETLQDLFLAVLLVAAMLFWG